MRAGPEKEQIRSGYSREESALFGQLDLTAVRFHNQLVNDNF